MDDTRFALDVGSNHSTMSDISNTATFANMFNVTNVSTTNGTFDVNTTLLPINVTCRNDYCVSDEEYVDMVLDYIFPTAFEWCLIVAYFVVFVIGLMGNFLVCFSVWRNPSMRTVTNYFIVNLAVGDFLVVLICLPPTVLDDVTETWYMGSVMCKITKYLQGVSVCVSVLTLSCISVERMYAICHPLKFKSTPERCRLIIIVIWCISMVIYVPELIALDTYSRFPRRLTMLLTACRSSWPAGGQTVFLFFLCVGMYILPLLLMFRNYVLIAKCLWSTTIPTETSRDHLKSCEGGGRSSSGHDGHLHSRRKAAKMLIAVVIMFGISYLPVHLLNILRYTGELKHLPEKSIYFALVAHWLPYFNSAINPVIYNFMSAKFRREFQAACMFCCCRCLSGDPPRRAQVGYSYRYSHTLENKRPESSVSSRTQMTTVRV